jgi:hypothetical protein
MVRSSSDASINSESSISALLEEKRRLAVPRRQPIPRSRSSGSATTATDASRALPNTNRRVVVGRESNTSSDSPSAVRGPARSVSAGATTTSRRPIASLHHPVDVAKMQMKNPRTRTPTIPTKRTKNTSTASSCKSTTCSSDLDDHSVDSCDGMTVLELLAEKIRLAGRPLPGTIARVTSTTTTPVRRTVGIRRKPSVCRGGGSSEKQQYKTSAAERSSSLVALDDDTLHTMPGAIFMPGISSSCCDDDNDDDDSDMDDTGNGNNNNNVEESNKTLDFPVHGQSSGAFSSAEESVHLGVAVATKVDEEDVTYVKAMPIVDEVETNKQKIPFHKTRLWCKVSLIVFISLLAIGLATITIIFRGNDNGSDGHTLAIRQEIASLVGRENLESPDSPYAKALEWIIHQDPMELVPAGDDADSNQHLVQRYIMAYLYFATTTKGPWRSCNPPDGSISDSDDFEFCYLYEMKHFFELGQEKQIPATRWLSSVHECQFGGVVCNANNQVIRLELSKFLQFL